MTGASEAAALSGANSELAAVNDSPTLKGVASTPTQIYIEVTPKISLFLQKFNEEFEEDRFDVSGETVSLDTLISAVNEHNTFVRNGKKGPEVLNEKQTKEQDHLSTDEGDGSSTTALLAVSTSDSSQKLLQETSSVKNSEGKDTMRETTLDDTGSNGEVLLHTLLRDSCVVKREKQKLSFEHLTQVEIMRANAAERKYQRYVEKNLQYIAHQTRSGHERSKDTFSSGKRSLLMGVNMISGLFLSFLGGYWACKQLGFSQVVGLLTGAAFAFLYSFVEVGLLMLYDVKLNKSSAKRNKQRLMLERQKLHQGQAPGSSSNKASISPVTASVSQALSPLVNGNLSLPRPIHTTKGSAVAAEGDLTSGRSSSSSFDTSVHEHQQIQRQQQPGAMRRTSLSLLKSWQALKKSSTVERSDDRSETETLDRSTPEGADDLRKKSKEHLPEEQVGTAISSVESTEDPSVNKLAEKTAPAPTADLHITAPPESVRKRLLVVRSSQDS